MCKEAKALTIQNAHYGKLCLCMSEKWCSKVKANEKRLTIPQVWLATTVPHLSGHYCITEAIVSTN